MSERADVFFLPGVDSQQGLAEATRSCSVQSAGFLGLWFCHLVERERLRFFFFLLWRLLFATALDDNCPLGRARCCQLWCKIIGSPNRRFRLSDVIPVRVQTGFTVWNSRSKSAAFMDAQPEFERTQHFHLCFFLFFSRCVYALLSNIWKWKAKIKPVDVRSVTRIRLPEMGSE